MAYATATFVRLEKNADGTTDVLAWNFGGLALPAGLSVQASGWWTE